MAACQTHERPIGSKKIKSWKMRRQKNVRAVRQDWSCKTSTTKCSQAHYTFKKGRPHASGCYKSCWFKIHSTKGRSACHSNKPCNAAVSNPARLLEYTQMNTKLLNGVMMVFKTAPTVNWFNTQPDAGRQGTSALHAVWELSTASEAEQQHRRV